MLVRETHKADLGDISNTMMVMIGWSKVGHRRQFEPRMLGTQLLGWKWLAAVACCIVSVVIYGHVMIKTKKVLCIVWQSCRDPISWCFTLAVSTGALQSSVIPSIH